MFYVIETVCARCGEVNDHYTAYCPALSLPLCMKCADQHTDDWPCLQTKRPSLGEFEAFVQRLEAIAKEG